MYFAAVMTSWGEDRTRTGDNGRRNGREAGDKARELGGRLIKTKVATASALFDSLFAAGLVLIYDGLLSR